MNNEITRHKVGLIGVDSGLVMICDPCYLDKFGERGNDSELGDGEFRYSLQGCDEAASTPDRCGQLVFDKGWTGAGVVSTTGIGDGTYEVFALKQQVPGCGERIIKLEIVFLEAEKPAKSDCRDGTVLTLVRAARSVGVTQKWLKQQADEGAVPCLKAGTRYLFNLDALTASLSDRAASSQVSDIEVDSA